MDLTDLFKKQAELDETIAKNHNVTYASTRSRRIMALIVEIGAYLAKLLTFPPFITLGALFSRAYAVSPIIGIIVNTIASDISIANIFPFNLLFMHNLRFCFNDQT